MGNTTQAKTTRRWMISCPAEISKHFTLSTQVLLGHLWQRLQSWPKCQVVETLIDLDSWSDEHNQDFSAAFFSEISFLISVTFKPNKQVVI